MQITLTGNKSHFLHNIFTNPCSYWLVCLKLIFVMWGFLCKNVNENADVSSSWMMELPDIKCLLMINTGYEYDNCYKAPKTLDILCTEKYLTSDRYRHLW